MPVAAAHAAWIDFSQGARDIALMVGGKLDGSLVRNDRAYTFSAGGSAIQMHIPHKDFGGPLSVILMNLSNEARKCRTD
jgi:hypothetical protein